MTKRMIAEALGTFILVFLGCGAIVFTGDQIGVLGIALAFGLTIVAAAHGIGPISGAHLNPAVSLGMVAAGRMTVAEFAAYAAAQVAGAVAAILVVWLIASGRADYSIAANGLGQTTVGAYGLRGALVFEFVATFLFVTVILGATTRNGAEMLAGVAIGLTLVLVHLAGIAISGASVNPARSLAPALFVGGEALAQIWVYVAAPLAGGALAGAAHRAGLTRAAAPGRA